MENCNYSDRLALEAALIMTGRKFSTRQIVAIIREKLGVKVWPGTVRNDMLEIGRVIPLEITMGCNGGFQMITARGAK